MSIPDITDEKTLYRERTPWPGWIGLVYWGSIEAVEYRPILEFGGWGVRGTARRRAWTARGHRAVLLTLTGDRLLYVGTDHPQRLEERIRTTMSARPEG